MSFGSCENKIFRYINHKTYRPLKSAFESLRHKHQDREIITKELLLNKKTRLCKSETQRMSST